MKRNRFLAFLLGKISFHSLHLIIYSGEFGSLTPSNVKKPSHLNNLPI